MEVIKGGTGEAKARPGEKDQQLKRIEQMEKYLDDAEIADVLGVSLGTVRSRIHRGRARLREALAHRSPQAQRGAGSSGPLGLNPLPGASS